MKKAGLLLLSISFCLFLLAGCGARLPGSLSHPETTHSPEGGAPSSSEAPLDQIDDYTNLLEGS